MYTEISGSGLVQTWLVCWIHQGVSQSVSSEEGFLLMNIASHRYPAENQTCRRWPDRHDLSVHSCLNCKLGKRL